MVHILLVEDDDPNRRALTALLEQAGYTVVAVADALAAYDRVAAQEGFHAIVCDVRLPQLSGPSFFQQIEEHYPNAAGRVVFLTAYADEPTIKEFLASCGQPYLEKPIVPERLLEAVRLVAQKPGGPKSPF